MTGLANELIKNAIPCAILWMSSSKKSSLCQITTLLWKTLRNRNYTLTRQHWATSWVFILVLFNLQPTSRFERNMDRVDVQKNALHLFNFLSFYGEQNKYNRTKWTKHINSRETRTYFSICTSLKGKRKKEKMEKEAAATMKAKWHSTNVLLAYFTDYEYINWVDKSGWQLTSQC